MFNSHLQSSLRCLLRALLLLVVFFVDLVIATWSAGTRDVPVANADGFHVIVAVDVAFTDCDSEALAFPSSE